MMGTRLHWVNGPWKGRLAMAARPRGGQWLEDEMAHWRSGGIDTVLSLLEPHEERDLELTGEGSEARAQGMRFRSFPIGDRQVPESEAGLARLLDELEGELAEGRNVVLHCRQGIGRTGLVAASLLVTAGIPAAAAVERLSEARGLTVPETPEQMRWIEHFAVTLAPAS